MQNNLCWDFMGEQVNDIKEIVLLALQPKAWLIALIQFVLGIAGVLFSLLPAGILLVASIMLAEGGHNTIGFLVLLVAATAFIALVFLVSAFVNGFAFSAAKNFAETKDFNAENSLGIAKNKTFKILKMQVIYSIFVLAVLLILMIPAIISGISGIMEIASQSPEVFFNPIQGENPAAADFSKFAPLAPAILMALIGLAVFIIINLLLLPIAVLLTPVIVFENTGAIEGIKRAIVLGKKNYFKNFSFMLLVCAASIPAYGVVLAINIFIADASLSSLLQLPFNLLLGLLWVFASIKMHSITAKTI